MFFDRIIRRRQAYRAVFLNPARGELNNMGEVVLRDLAKFCRGNRHCIVYGSNGQIDPIASAVVQGRREVWLRITEHLYLSDEVIANLTPPAEE